MILTTLAIVGSGIVGRSLLYALALEKKSFKKVTLFHSDNFHPPCTFHSTAVVASRGVTRGHSALGDLLCDGLEEFMDHVRSSSPAGVTKARQLTGATKNLETFKKRYPSGKMTSEIFREDTYVAEEKAFIIDPRTYTAWLFKEAQNFFRDDLEILEDFVTEIEYSEEVVLKTQSKKTYSFDKVIFAGGSGNRFWKEMFHDLRIKNSKGVSGSYLEFNDVVWDLPSLSLTLNGDNLVWNNPQKRLLIGSTSHEANELLPRRSELEEIYARLEAALNLSLPVFSSGLIKTGSREKAKKREPYVACEKNVIFIGGLYKNGFILSLKMAKDLSRQFL